MNRFGYDSTPQEQYPQPYTGTSDTTVDPATYSRMYHAYGMDTPQDNNAVFGASSRNYLDTNSINSNLDTNIQNNFSTNFDGSNRTADVGFNNAAGTVSSVVAANLARQNAANFSDMGFGQKAGVVTSAINTGVNLYNGINQARMAKKTFDEQKREFNKNFGMQQKAFDANQQHYQQARDDYDKYQSTVRDFARS